MECVRSSDAFKGKDLFSCVCCASHATNANATEERQPNKYCVVVVVRGVATLNSHFSIHIQIQWLAASNLMLLNNNEKNSMHGTCYMHITYLYNTNQGEAFVYNLHVWK